MPDDLTDLLRDHARFVEARCPDGEAVARDMLEAAAEIERLRAIVKKVSANLTPLLQGCNGCEWDEAEGDLYRHCDGCQERVTREAYLLVSEINSTASAASAAKEKEHGPEND